MPETLWEYQVKGFAPLIVSIDIEGNNLYRENRNKFKQKKKKFIKRYVKNKKIIYIRKLRIIL